MADDLTALRWQYKDVAISPDIAQAFLDTYLNQQVARILTDMLENPESVRNMLTEAKKLISQTGDLHPARYALCTQVLLKPLELYLSVGCRRRY